MNLIQTLATAELLRDYGVNYEDRVRIVQTLQANPDTYGIVPAAPPVPDYSSHDAKVQAGEDSDLIRDLLHNGRKIQAIKEMRTLTGASLYDAKAAIEDARLELYYVRPF